MNKRNSRVLQDSNSCSSHPVCGLRLPLVREIQTSAGAAGRDEPARGMASYFEQASPGGKVILQRQTSHSRRLHSRVEALENVYVYWRSAGGEDVAPVRNLSMGGLFIETDKPKVPGIPAKLHFLVQEGQIRADAVVRHAKPGHGLGLRFTAVHNEDGQRLAELMTRLRRSA